VSNSWAFAGITVQSQGLGARPLGDDVMGCRGHKKVNLPRAALTAAPPLHCRRNMNSMKVVVTVMYVGLQVHIIEFDVDEVVLYELCMIDVWQKFASSKSPTTADNPKSEFQSNTTVILSDNDEADDDFEMVRANSSSSELNVSLFGDKKVSLTEPASINDSDSGQHCKPPFSAVPSPRSVLASPLAIKSQSSTSLASMSSSSTQNTGTVCSRDVNFVFFPKIDYRLEKNRFFFDYRIWATLSHCAASIRPM